MFLSHAPQPHPVLDWVFIVPQLGICNSPLLTKDPTLICPTQYDQSVPLKMCLTVYSLAKNSCMFPSVPSDLIPKSQDLLQTCSRLPLAFFSHKFATEMVCCICPEQTQSSGYTTVLHALNHKMPLHSSWAQVCPSLISKDFLDPLPYVRRLW